MTGRERAYKAIHFQPTDDGAAVQYYYSPVGYYEHGEKLNELYKQYEGDFEPFQKQPIPIMPLETRNQRGEYYERKKDEWGTTWEYRIFGIMGHVLQPAITDPKQYETLIFPPYASPIKRDRLKAAAHKKNYYLLQGGGFSYFERLIALRGFENALIDLMEDSEPFNQFLDRLTDYYLQKVYDLLELDVDAVAFGDDYGTQQGLIISTDLFEHSIAPRLKRLIDPIKRAGKQIHFHSCGKITSLLDSLKKLGITSIWPQLPVYDMQELADICREYQFGCAIHTDRANTMTFGSPEDVKQLVHKEFEIFRPDLGGSWFYVEADTEFPFENIEALVKTIFSFRR